MRVTAASLTRLSSTSATSTARRKGKPGGLAPYFPPATWVGVNTPSSLAVLVGSCALAGNFRRRGDAKSSQLELAQLVRSQSGVADDMPIIT